MLSDDEELSNHTEEESPGEDQTSALGTRRPMRISRETYEALSRLSDDGCPLVLDLDAYEIVGCDADDQDS